MEECGVTGSRVGGDDGVDVVDGDAGGMALPASETSTDESDVNDDIGAVVD
jgi:hypothetical protein